MTAYTEADLAAELEQSKLHVRISLFCFFLFLVFLLPEETNSLIYSLRMMMSHSFGMMVVELLRGFFFSFFFFFSIFFSCCAV
jgi:hypothetical protein